MIVTKFAGTSLADALAVRRVIQVIEERRAERPVVVVSAHQGVTDALQGLERHPRPADALAAIGERHRRIAVELGLGSSELDRIGADLATLGRWLLTRGRDGWTAEDRDRVVSHGELWSSRLVVAALRAAGIPSDWVDARHFMVTDDHFSDATVNQAELAKRSARFLAPLLASGRVPVTPGFIGTTADGRTTTLGRGGSDYTAALLGVALAAQRVELWSDADGIMTADPAIVADARVIAETTYEEAADLALFGARVPHPATHGPLHGARIPCLVKNAKAPERSGTVILRRDERSEPAGAVRAVAIKRGVTSVSIRRDERTAAGDFLRTLAASLARHDVRAAVLASSDRSASVTVDDAALDGGLGTDLERLGSFQRRRGRSLIGLVGTELGNVARLANRIVTAMRHVETEIIAHGGSDTSVALVVRDDDGPEVVRRLHAEFVGMA
jgi:aspartate kinase